MFFFHFRLLTAHNLFLEYSKVHTISRNWIEKIHFVHWHLFCILSLVWLTPNELVVRSETVVGESGRLCYFSSYAKSINPTSRILEPKARRPPMRMELSQITNETAVFAFINSPACIWPLTSQIVAHRTKLYIFSIFRPSYCRHMRGWVVWQPNKKKSICSLAV